MRSVGPDSKQSWVVAMACFIIQIMSFGLTEVSGLFFVATIPRYKTQRELASLPYTLTYCMRSAIGPLIGYLGCRFGIRQVTLAGCIVSTIAVGACFFVDDIVPLIILWGIVFGFSLGLETSLLNVILNEHFVKNRVKANGLNTAGASIGNMLLSPVISYLIEDAYGLSGTFLIISGLMLNSIPAAVIIMLNKPKSHAVDKNAYTTDIESVLKLRTSLAPAMDVKMERKFSNSETRSKSIPNCVVDEEANENGSENGYFNTNLIHAVQCNDSSGRRNFSYPFCEESELCSKKRDEACTIAEAQAQNDSLNNDYDKMCSMFSIKDRSKSLILNPSQLGVIPENGDNPLKANHENGLDLQDVDNADINTSLRDNGLLDQRNRNNSKSANLDTWQFHRTFASGQNTDLKNNEIFVKSNRDENQSTATSLSELTKPAWTNGCAYFYNHPEMENSPDEKPTTNSFSLQIPNNKVSENGKSILSPVCGITIKSEEKSKWQVYRLACEPVYLLLLVGSGIYYFSVTTFLTIIVDFATDMGLSITYSTYILMWVGLWDIIAYATLGCVIQRGYFTQSKFACLSYLGMCLTSVTMVFSQSYIVLLFIITLFEFSQAGVIILSAPLVAELIDQDLQATAIASVTLLSAPVSLAISPLIGYFRDGSGSYAGLFYVISASSFLCCLLFLCIPKVKRRQGV